MRIKYIGMFVEKHKIKKFLIVIFFASLLFGCENNATKSSNLDSNNAESTQSNPQESKVASTQDIQADSLNDSDLALLDEVFWDRVFYDFWTNEKCLVKEIVTNKKQRLFITKGAMESLIYHLQGVSKNGDKYIFATDDDETTLEVLIKNDSIDMNFASMNGGTKVYSMESEGLFDLPSGVANGRQNGITTKADTTNYKICTDTASDDEGSEWVIKDIEKILQEYLR